MEKLPHSKGNNQQNVKEPYWKWDDIFRLSISYKANVWILITHYWISKDQNKNIQLTFNKESMIYKWADKWTIFPKKDIIKVTTGTEEMHI